MSFSVSERTEKRRDLCNLIGCGEIGSDGWQSSFGFAPLGQAYEEAFKADPRVVLVKINDKEDVWPALKKFFAKGHPEIAH